MGVDFFPCESCGESICDCGDYWRCEDCGKVLCEDCERKYIGFATEPEDQECPFCKKEIATDSQLLVFAIKKLRTTMAKLLKEYKSAKP